MKKLNIISILALSIACPAFANIATDNSNPKCDNNTIGAYSGSTELEAQWTANKINLKWYNENIEITDVDNDSKTCTYAGNITLPTEPTRPGYTFNQWVIRPNTVDLSALDYGTVPTWDTTHVHYRSYFGDKYETSGDQTGLNDGEWRIVFENVTIKGTTMCAKNYGTYAEAGIPEETGGYCWCQATSALITGDEKYKPVSSHLWIAKNAVGGSCLDICPRECAKQIINDEQFRAAIFGK